LEGAKFDPSTLSVASAQSVDEKLLLDFYRAMYGERARSLERVWRWLSRPGFWDHTGPMVFLLEGRVVAHLGLVPFRATLDGESYVVTRSTDFAVRPELQRHGLGVLLLNEWMNLPDVQIGWPNDKAVGTCRKVNWGESADSYLHFYLLRPFDHPRLAGSLPPAVRRALNGLASPPLSMLYRRHAAPAGALSPEAPTEDSVSVLATSTPSGSGLLRPVHDRDYLRWRLVESPESPRYKVFRVGDLAAAVKLCEKRGHAYIDLLCVSAGCAERDVRRLISSLAVWGMGEGYSYVRFYTKNRGLSGFLRRHLRGIVKGTHFIFHSPDSALTEKLRHSAWHLELIDGDFEEF
jgi:GNAT superfamily N-acetyltransferase